MFTSSSRSLASSWLLLVAAGVLACDHGLPRSDDDREHRRAHGPDGNDEDAPSSAPPGDDGPPAGPDEDPAAPPGSGPAPEAPPSEDPDADEPVATDPCGAETLYGRCDGNTLVFCADDVVERQDCGDDACSLVNDELGFTCLDPAFARVLDQERPRFACATQAGAQLELELHAGTVIAKGEDGSERAGRYALQSDGTIAVAVDDVLEASFDTFDSAGGMIFRMSGPTVACAVLTYERDDTVEATAGCGGAFIEPGLVATDLAFALHRDGTVTVNQEMYLVVAGDVLTSTYHGVYRVTGAEIGIAWLDGDDVRGAVGYVDDDGFLVVPAFSDPVCND